MKINNFDPAEQANQIDQAIAQRPDALVVWPADATAIVPSLRKIKAANIPLVVTNSMPDPKFQSLWNIYTGPNDVANGETAAAVMKKGFEEKGYGPTGTIFVILGVLGTPPQIQRLDGFGKGLASIAPGVKISGSQPGDWDQTKATDAAAALFTQLGDTVKGVYAEADNMLAGVIIAAQRAGRDPSKLVLVGSNCSIEGVKAIEEGVQYGTVLQSPVEDGTYAAQAVADLLDGKPVEKTRFLPHPAITKAISPSATRRSVAERVGGSPREHRSRSLVRASRRCGGFGFVVGSRLRTLPAAARAGCTGGRRRCRAGATRTRNTCRLCPRERERRGRGNVVASRGEG